jgi:hypothetical protein
MLEKLFSSRVRVRLLDVFLSNPKRRFYGRELERMTEEHQNAIWRELRNLSELGLLTDETEGRTKYYLVNQSFPLYPELRALLFKASDRPLDRPAPRSPSRISVPAGWKPYRPDFVVGEND